MANAGGFDCFTDTHRAQYFAHDGDGITFLEKAVKYGAKHQENENSAQVSLFGEASGVEIAEPQVPPSEDWGTMEKLSREKEVVGIYISGHPLDDFRIEIESFCRGEVRSLNEMENNKGKDLMIAAVVTEGEHRITRKGDGFGTLTIEDYNDSFKLNIFNEKYLKFKHFMDPGTFVIIKGRIEDHKWGKGLEFNVHAMQLLQGLRESKAKSLDLKLSFKSVNDDLISELQEVLMKTENKGKCSMSTTFP